MANNYLQFSVAVEVNPDKIDQLKSLNNWLKDVENQMFDNIDDIKLPDIVSGEESGLFDYLKRMMLEGCVDFTSTLYESEYYVYNDENGNIELATEWLFILIRLELLKPKTGYVVFTWAETCDKPRPDEFAGGAAVISRHGVAYQQNAWEWARNHYKKQCEEYYHAA